MTNVKTVIDRQFGGMFSLPIMSTLHLTTGSQEPARVEGQLRLYSMKYCPYAQRTRLVLKAKGLPHDIVNINLFNKPEWYFKLNPKGLVPTLLDGDNIVMESLDISEYLDEKYSENPLYPNNPEQKKRDKELIQNIAFVITVFRRCLFSDEFKTPEEWVSEFLEVVKKFEDELAKRGTKFFGGEKPGMVDYMLWPWADGADCIPLKFGAKLPFQENDIPALRKWRKAMRQHPVCDDIHNTPESFWKIAQAKFAGKEPNYDE